MELEAPVLARSFSTIFFVFLASPEDSLEDELSSSSEDDDDFLFPSSVEALVMASEKHSAGMAFHNRLAIAEHGQRLADLPGIEVPGSLNPSRTFLVPNECSRAG